MISISSLLTKGRPTPEKVGLLHNVVKDPRMPSSKSCINIGIDY